MLSWVSGLTYDLRSLDDVFLNSLTLRYYQYTMHTQMAPLFVPGKYDVDVHKSNWGVNNALRYRFLPSLMGSYRQVMRCVSLRKQSFWEMVLV